LRVLFATNHLGKLRHFPTVICGLAQRGHDVTIAVEGDATRTSLRLCRCHPPYPVVTAPARRSDAWAPYMSGLRTVRDYVRFLGPELGGAVAVAERARDWAYLEAPRFVTALERSRLLRRNLAAADTAARLVEDIVPSDPGHEAFLARHTPDVVLVTPIVEFGSSQPDIVKSAHRLGIPVAYLPFSWDNLSSKGLIRVIPDRVLVWNDIQRDEAVRWHEVPPDQIVVTGAPRFDEFWALEPSIGREDYLRSMGFEQEAPIVLLLGSSPLVAPDELLMVSEWLQALRSGPGDIASANVLLRPHPKNLAQWEAAAFEDERTRIHRVDSLKNVEQPLYDTLHHTAVVVGVNTSALLEAAIVGRSVHAPPPVNGTARSFGRTLHERYLSADGALLVSSASFAEHVAQLDAAAAGPSHDSERSTAFARSFLRPHGLDREVSPIMIDEIERLGAARKTPTVPPTWQRPVGAAVRALLRAGLAPGTA
jgi:hypothetical protein